jgi:hypothetical protein
MAIILRDKITQENGIGKKNVGWGVGVEGLGFRV